MNINYIDIVKEIVLKKAPLDKYAIFLFGSRAAGNAHKMSDIDVGFLGQTDLPMLLKEEIEHEIEESIVPYHVDLIDFNQVDNDFKEEALKNIIIWNSPETCMSLPLTKLHKQAHASFISDNEQAEYQ